jgi:hypothetical protein
MNPLHKINKKTKINVYNMRSTRSGEPVPNQIVVEVLTDKGRRSIFKSYETIIGMIDEQGCVTLDKNYRKSGTTEKYLNQFLGNTKPQRRKLIEQGVYQLADLN